MNGHWIECKSSNSFMCIAFKMHAVWPIDREELRYHISVGFGQQFFCSNFTQCFE